MKNHLRKTQRKIEIFKDAGQPHVQPMYDFSEKQLLKLSSKRKKLLFIPWGCDNIYPDSLR